MNNVIQFQPILEYADNLYIPYAIYKNYRDNGGDVEMIRRHSDPDIIDDYEQRYQNERRQQ